MNMDFTSSDLVLRLVDGSASGQFFPIRTQKCLLGNTTDANTSIRENMEDQRCASQQCAIFRGPSGTALRCNGESVTINGKMVESAWLSKGDQIRLGDSVIEVYQLGLFPNSSSSINSQDLRELVIAEPNAEPNAEDREVAEHIDCGPIDNCDAAVTGAPEQQILLDNELSRKIEELEERMETRFHSICDESKTAAARFDELDSRMEQLAETLTLIADSLTCDEHPIEEQPEDLERVDVEIPTTSDKLESTHEDDTACEASPTNSTDSILLSEDMERVFKNIGQEAVSDGCHTSDPKQQSEPSCAPEHPCCSEPEEVFVADSDEDFESPEVFNDQSELSQLDEQEPSESEPSLTSMENLESVMENALRADSSCQDDKAIEIEESATPVSQSESVAEILARMQSQGQLEGYQPCSEDNLEDSIEEPLEQLPADIETPSIPSPIESQEKLTGDDEGSVEDYMNRLLGRMGGKPEAQPKPVDAPETFQEDRLKVAKPEPIALLTPSEYKPAKSAPESDEHLVAMRELANQDNRFAMDRAKKRRARAVQVTNFSVMGLGLMFSVYLISTSAGMRDVIFWAGALTMGLSLGIGAIATKSLMPREAKSPAPSS